MDKNPETRATIDEILQHPFITQQRSKRNLELAIKNMKTHQRRLKLKASQIAIFTVNYLKKKTNN